MKIIKGLASQPPPGKLLQAQLRAPDITNLAFKLGNFIRFTLGMKNGERSELQSPCFRATQITCGHFKQFRSAHTSGRRLFRYSTASATSSSVQLRVWAFDTVLIDFRLVGFFERLVIVSSASALQDFFPCARFPEHRLCEPDQQIMAPSISVGRGNKKGAP
ncbi:hypothetical protein DUT91_23195 [Phyllobacterium salinisoli]|uniref:Uncharacterized protein n=2 Tax=Phyllobacterium salinisoli TaxID=1899321 RepID=A0A368JYP7_9HYPH|nr:hypothetical protein DUT91_23195 [Phyllobacterium salinisoli]